MPFLAEIDTERLPFSGLVSNRDWEIGRFTLQRFSASASTAIIQICAARMPAVHFTRQLVVYFCRCDGHRRDSVLTRSSLRMSQGSSVSFSSYFSGYMARYFCAPLP